MQNRDASFGAGMLLGGASGAVSKTLLAPVDRIKMLISNQHSMVDMGLLPRYFRGFFDAVQLTARSMGIGELWRGNLTNIVRYLPITGISFGIYEATKRRLDPLSFGRHFVAGSLAGVASIAIVYPLDIARLRLARDTKRRTKEERQFNGLMNVFRTVYRAEGIAAFYPHFGITALGVSVWRGLYLGIFDTAMSKQQPGLLLTAAIAYTGSLLAGLVSYPIDMVRRRLFMASPDRGALECARSMHEGSGSFFKGGGALILRSGQGMIILTAYEYLRRAFVFD